MKIADIMFDERKMYLRVEMADGECCRTHEHPLLPNALFDIVPAIRHHRCDNDEALAFEEEAQDTEIPHLFEHLVIELQVEAVGGDLSGETSWDWTRDPRGCFRVAVDYQDEVLALGAVRLAMRIINAVDTRGVDTIDLDWEIARLRRIVRDGRRRNVAVRIPSVIETA